MDKFFIFNTVSVFCILCYNWFVNGAAYYGLTLASGEIGKKMTQMYIKGETHDLDKLFIFSIRRIF
jgi:hypothetical protein